MSDAQTLADQPVNLYKAGGKYVFYCQVKPRAFKEGKDPQLAYGKTSVVSMNIFSTEEKKSVQAWLDGSDPAYLLEKTRAIMSRPQQAAAEGTPNTPAYTMRFKFGPFKDMTPAQAIEQNVDELKRQYSQLKENLAKYPANKGMIDAIYEAFDLKSKGQLVVSAAPAAVEEVLIDEMKTPNNKKLDQNGNTEVRLIKISYNAAGREPYKVEITNCMAPPANGQIGAIMSKATNKVTLSMTFSEKDWFMVVDELVHAKEMYSRATEGRRIMYAESKQWTPEN